MLFFSEHEIEFLVTNVERICFELVYELDFRKSYVSITLFVYNADIYVAFLSVGPVRPRAEQDDRTIACREAFP